MEAKRGVCVRWYRVADHGRLDEALKIVSQERTNSGSVHAEPDVA